MAGCATNCEKPSAESLKAAESIKQKVMENVVYPEKARLDNAEGRVILRFYNGKYELVKKAAYPLFNEQGHIIGTKVVALLTDFEKQQKVSIPITFKLVDPM